MYYDLTFQPDLWVLLCIHLYLNFSPTLLSSPLSSLPLSLPSFPSNSSLHLFSLLPPPHARGRYTVKPYPSFLQLHGKTFDYKIPYDTVTRIFLLPHNDQKQMYFVVSII